MIGDFSNNISCVILSDVNCNNCVFLLCFKSYLTYISKIKSIIKTINDFINIFK